MNIAVSLALLGVVVLVVGCRHTITLKVPALSPERVADSEYVASVIKNLPEYIADEQNARFEVQEIVQVEKDLNQLDVGSPDFHEQVQKLNEDVGTLVAKDKRLSSQDLI